MFAEAEADGDFLRSVLVGEGERDDSTLGML